MSDQQTTPPAPGQVYFATADAFGAIPEGRAALLVRTERRPGAEAPEHLLVMVNAGHRVVSERWETSDPELFASRWSLAYTPPFDAAKAHEAIVERAALAATLAEVPEAVILEAEGDLDLKARGALGQAVVARLRKSFTAHRARLHAENAGPKS